jgi:hypothetical protein
LRRFEKRARMAPILNAQPALVRYVLGKDMCRHYTPRLRRPDVRDARTTPNAAETKSSAGIQQGCTRRSRLAPPCRSKHRPTAQTRLGFLSF